ncbi:ATP-binding protein ASCRUDRAFT_71481 [Ascoidea rubescens DSM 1968]|uniref:Uncharacterized protein n=1 Tax=Ascoidea rubescens DSM 1968 TaxID=1344418 RepID=A0A1D2VD04_9ASCO|nr:hypothetical protein ASCRUDRAFT_71481 [Ascoidea rubescens DSM 1968]ODV59515.1 hypothetical protein ASCRUDRAFT_71481 [Ascoidea rubescens DSM 1968]
MLHPQMFKRFIFPIYRRNISNRLLHSSSAQRINLLLPFDLLEDQNEKDEKSDQSKENTENKNSTESQFKNLAFKCLETVGITFSSLAILAFGGYSYHKIYQHHVISQMNSAFDEGFDTFESIFHSKNDNYLFNRSISPEEDSTDWVARPEQNSIDNIITGKIKGRYYLILGEKGTGKTSILLEAIKHQQGKNVIALDAHADPEIFRLRLGKALKFSFYEDYIGSLFSIRGPRETTALLDIERAFTKLEEVAIERVHRLKNSDSPLIIIINNCHLIREDETGLDLVELLQQKAESLSGSGLVTMIFNSDDYWFYERLKILATRLDVINIKDFNKLDAINAIQVLRKKNKNEDLSVIEASKIYNLIGGRIQHLAKVCKNDDMIKTANELIDAEKTWLLNKCGLIGMGMDDDVMQSGKFSNSAMLLVKEFVEMDKEFFNHYNSLDKNISPNIQDNSYRLPSLPLWRARQVMTRPDLIRDYDALNIFTIDKDARVRPDSIPMLRAFHEIYNQSGFLNLLNENCERVSAIESLGRTRELVAKDLILGANYKIDDNKRIFIENYNSEDDIENIPMQSIGSGSYKEYWKLR